MLITLLLRKKRGNRNRTGEAGSNPFSGPAWKHGQRIGSKDKKKDELPSLCIVRVLHRKGERSEESKK